MNKLRKIYNGKNKLGKIYNKNRLNMVFIYLTLNRMLALPHEFKVATVLNSELQIVTRDYDACRGL